MTNPIRKKSIRTIAIMLVITMMLGLLPAKSVSALTVYTVIWKDADGTVLRTDEYEKGTMPEGPVIEDSEDAHYTYSFKAWTPKLTSVSSNKTYTATYNKVAKKFNVTVHFTGILNANGTVKESSASQQLSAGTSWSFTQKKLDNQIPVKKMTIGDTIYEYTGTWQYEDGTVFVPPFSISGKDITEDVEYIAVFEPEEN